MKEINITTHGQFFQRAYWMLDQDRMADEVRNYFGNRFDDDLRQNDFSAVWRECSDRDFMLWMLRRSPYGRSYYSELCDLVRSLDPVRIAAGLESLDAVLACQRVVLEETYAKETDRDDRVSEQLWEMVWDLADFWTRDAWENEIGKAIFDGRYPDLDSERVAYRVSTYKTLIQDQAKRLRDLIANPFVPKVALH